MTKTFKSKLANCAGGIVASVIAMTAFGAASAWAKPLKIESENIVFFGDVDPVLAKERVQKWETYRKMIYALSGVSNPPADTQKLTIYGFRDTRELQKFTGNRGIAGVYTNGVDGPIFLTSVNNSYMEDGFSEQVGFHEYTHHVLHSFVREGFPRWYDEGFANYLATMSITDDTVAVGDPSVGHVKSVVKYRLDWLDPETVLKAIAFYPNYKRREMRKGGPTVFYAQAWLYVHYMRSQPKYNNKLTEYLKLIDTPGIDPLDAFEQAFAVSVEDFHKEAANYFRNDDFVVNQYIPGPEIMTSDMKVAAMSEEDLKAAQIPARLAFLNDKTARNFLKDLNKAYKKDPSNPRITMGFVSYDIHQESYEDAVARSEAALAASPSDPYLMHAAAGARFASVSGPHFEALEDEEYKPLPMNDDMKVALNRYEQLLQRDPTDLFAVRQVTTFYGNSDMPATDAALDAARMIDQRYMDGFEPFNGMNLAVIYAKSGYELYACDYYQKSTESVKDFKDRQLGNFKARLDWFKTNYGQNCEFDDGEG